MQDMHAPNWSFVPPLKSQKGASHLKDIFALRWKRDKSLEGTIEKVLAILAQSLAFICGRSV